MFIHTIYLFFYSSDEFKFFFFFFIKLKTGRWIENKLTLEFKYRQEENFE